MSRDRQSLARNGPDHLARSARIRRTWASVALLGSTLLSGACSDPEEPHEAAAPTILTLSPDTARVVLPRTFRLTALFRDTAGATAPSQPLHWTSVDNTVATVDSTGLVTAVALGVGRIVALGQELADTAVVVVIPIVTVTSDLPSLFAGDTTLLAVVVTDGDLVPLPGVAVQWVTTNSDIAGIADGILTGRQPGLVAVEASAAGASDTVEVAVLRVPVGPDREIGYVRDTVGPAGLTVDLLMLIAADGANPLPVSPGEEIIDEYRWSRTGDRLLVNYLSLNGFGKSGTFLVRADGTGEIPLGIGVLNPDWSPTDARIAFRDRPAVGQSDVWTANPDGSSRGRITNFPGDELTPQWSPDGRRIAFRHPVPGRASGYGLWIMRADGGSPRPLALPVEVVGFQWSPDGKQIALDNGKGIWVVRADGSGARAITDNCDSLGDCPGTQVYMHAVWSPDARRLAFSGSPFNGYDWSLHVSEPSGTNRIDLQLGSGGIYPLPQWSPSGTWIVAQATRPPDGWPSIVRIRADLSDPLFLTDNQNAFRPRWR